MRATTVLQHSVEQAMIRVKETKQLRCNCLAFLRCSVCYRLHKHQGEKRYNLVHVRESCLHVGYTQGK